MSECRFNRAKRIGGYSGELPTEGVEMPPLDHRERVALAKEQAIALLERLPFIDRAMVLVTAPAAPSSALCAPRPNPAEGFRDTSPPELAWALPKNSARPKRLLHKACLRARVRPPAKSAIRSLFQMQPISRRSRALATGRPGAWILGPTEARS